MLVAQLDVPEDSAAPWTLTIPRGVLVFASADRSRDPPLIIDRIYEVIAKLRDEMKMTVLLVEQNAQRALDIADYGYILETGRVTRTGDAPEMYPLTLQL